MKILKYKNIVLYLLAPFFYEWIKEYGKLSANPFSDFMTIWYLGITLWIMASRAFESAKKVYKKGAASSDYAAGKLRSSEKRRNAAATSDFKKVVSGKMNALDAIKKHFPMN